MKRTLLASRARLQARRTAAVYDNNLRSRPHAGSVAHFLGSVADQIGPMCLRVHSSPSRGRAPRYVKGSASGWLVGSELTCARCHHSTRHIEGYWSSFKSAASGLLLAATVFLTQARAKVAGPIKKK